jgi:hypothetical protein
VCAPEVKKKFQKCETVTQRTQEKYFANEHFRERAHSIAGKRDWFGGAGVLLAGF